MQLLKQKFQWKYGTTVIERYQCGHLVCLNHQFGKFWRGENQIPHENGNSFQTIQTFYSFLSINCLGFHYFHYSCALWKRIILYRKRVHDSFIIFLKKFLVFYLLSFSCFWIRQYPYNSHILRDIIISPHIYASLFL